MFMKKNFYNHLIATNYIEKTEAQLQIFGFQTDFCAATVEFCNYTLIFATTLNFFETTVDFFATTFDFCFNDKSTVVAKS